MRDPHRIPSFQKISKGGFQMKLIEPNVFYNYDEEKRKRYVKRVENYIRKNGTDLEKAMLEIVEKKVKHYQTDFFVHDFYMLNTETEKNEYIWAVRETGTWLIPLDEIEKYRFLLAEKHTLFAINTKENSIKRLRNKKLA